MRALLLPALLSAAAALALPGCSITAANGFTECATDVQCGARGACAQGYCVPLPGRCSRAEGTFDQPNRIPLAALLALSGGGDAGTAGETEAMRLDAIVLAVGEVNAQDGLSGRHFGLFSCDPGLDDDELQREAAWFSTQLQVPAIFTSGSAQTAAAFAEPSRADAGTLIMSASSTGPELIPLYQADRSVWRVAPPDTLQARVLARLLQVDPVYASPASVKVAIVYESTPYGQGLQLALSAALVAAGKTAPLAIPISAPLDDAATSAALDALVNFGPDTTVLVGQAASVVRLVTAAKASRQSLTRAQGHRWLLTDSARDPAINTADTRSELVGMLGTSPAQGAGASFADFKNRFVARFKADPSNSTYTSQSYDAAYLVMLASAWAASKNHLDGPTLAEGLGKVCVTGSRGAAVGPNTWRDAANTLLAGNPIDLDGASGHLDFDLNSGAPPAPYEVWKVGVDGRIATLKYMDPAP